MSQGLEIFRIFEWTAAVYNEKKRIWFYGTLSIHPQEICFQSSDTKAEVRELKIPFTDIVKVEKSRTGLVYGAIVVVKSNNEKVWFSSLEDREGVFGAIEHFRKYLLLGTKCSKPGQLGGGQTQIGQKLLGIVQDSQETFSKARVQLHSQGQQFDSMLTAMSDIHNDLDVGENLLQDIDSWCGRWRLPEQYAQIDPVIINKADVPDVFEYEVLLTKLEPSKISTKRIGAMRVTNDGITLLNMKMRTEHHFRWSDISYIRVITPWEIFITQCKIGSPDLSYGIVSAQMTAVLRLLEKCVKYKMRYEMPPEKILVCSHKKSQERSRGPLQTGLKEASGSSDNDTFVNTNIGTAFTTGLSQLQISQSERVVSESEADELNRRLAGLKALAVATQEEQCAQDEKMGHLIPSVERANQRLKEANCRANKLI